MQSQPLEEGGPVVAWWIETEMDYHRWLGPYTDLDKAIEECLTWAPEATVRWRNE